MAILAASAQANVIGVGNYVQFNGTSTLPYIEDGTITYNNGSGYTTESGGAGLFQLNGQNLSTSQNITIYTFCTDVGEWWNYGATYTYKSVQFGGADGVNPAWQNTPASIQDASYLYNQYYVNNPSSINSAATAAGMQLAIWKVLYDANVNGLVNLGANGTATFASGNLQASFSTAAMNYAQTLLQDVNSARGGSVNFGAYQDQWLMPVQGVGNDTLYPTQGMLYNTSTPVPEPTTMVAGALLLLPFGASTLRFLRKNRAA